MRFTNTAVDGAFLIEIEPQHDARGFFARIYSADAFFEHGLDPTIVESSMAHNTAAGTLRGLHYQAAPHGETKLIRCVRGALYAVAADLRADSPTYLRHVGVELTAHNRRALYVPKGCATGYQTLEDDTDIMYEMGVRHAPGSACGIHHADPRLGIAWPLPVAVISERDAAFSGLEPVPAH